MQPYVRQYYYPFLNYLLKIELKKREGTVQ